MPTGLTGAAGEYYVAAELSRRGWLATVTVKNAPGTDVLAQNALTRRTIAIQVKTSWDGRSFHVGSKDYVTFPDDEGWMMFVGLGELPMYPDFFVIPRSHLATMLSVGKGEYMERPRRDGQPHKESPSWGGVLGREYVEGYLGRWDLLDEPASRAHYLGAPEYLEWLKVERWRPEYVPQAMRRRTRAVRSRARA
jgi:hypothetical protein